MDRLGDRHSRRPGFILGANQADPTPMHFTAMTVENVGPFRGTQHLDFACGAPRNITVVCGAGGTGKTSCLKALEWALTGELPESGSISGRHLRHDVAAPVGGDTAVTLSFSLGRVEHQLRRRHPDVMGTSGMPMLELCLRPPGNQDWTPVSDPAAYLGKKIPPGVCRFLFVFEHWETSRTWPHRLARGLATPGFRSWAKKRIEGGSILAHHPAASRIIDLLREMLTLEPVKTMTSIAPRLFADFQLMTLLREWMLSSPSLSRNLRHLEGEPLPWLLDSPFGALDLFARQEAAKLFMQSGTQVVLAASPTELIGEVEGVFAPRLGQLYQMRMREHPVRGATHDIFGYRLNMARADKLTFSDIVPVGLGPTTSPAPVYHPDDRSTAASPGVSLADPGSQETRAGGAAQ